jgi:hypothetical protein
MTAPRSPIVMAGVRSSAMPESNTTAQSAPRASVRIHSETAALPASSSPSTTTRTFTGRAPARDSSHATCSSGRKLPLSSAAPRA